MSAPSWEGASTQSCAVAIDPGGPPHQRPGTDLPWRRAAHVTTATLVTFALASTLLLIAVPGPSVLFIVGRALAVGRVVAVMTALGNAGGVVVLTAVIALGAGPVLQRPAFTAPKHPHEGGRAFSVAHRGALGVLVVGVLDPQALVVFSAVLPQLVEPAAGTVPPRSRCWGW